MKSKFLFFAAFLFVAFLSKAQADKALTADEVVAKHIEAIGGADAWKKVTSMVQTAELEVQGTQVEVIVSVLHLKGNRQDISVAGMTGYLIVNTTEGWSYMPFQGQSEPEAYSADRVKEQQDELDAQGILLDYKAKGNTVELVGKEDIDGTECYKLSVTTKSGTKTMFIDSKNFYNIRTVEKMKANDQEVEITYNFSEFKKLPEGIVVPMKFENSGMPAPITITKVEINKPLDESFFKKPSN